MTLELDERRFGLLPVLVASKVNSCAAKFLALSKDKAELSFKENYRTQYSLLVDMQKRIFLAWTLIVLLSLAAEQSSGSFFSSLQFTRDALMDFSRGSQRTLDINLEPKKTMKMVNKTYTWRKSKAKSMAELVEVKDSGKKSVHRKLGHDKYATMPSEKTKNLLDPSMRKDLPKQLLTTIRVDKEGKLRPLILIPVNETVIINQTKREVYRPRTSPSNKFVKAINDIELAQTNAYASDVNYSSAALAKLK